VKSGLRRALSVRNTAPPQLSGGGSYGLSSLAMGGSDDETYMRSYGSVGTIFSIVSLYASGTARPAWNLYRKSETDPNRYTKRDEGSDQRKQVFTHAALSTWNRPNPFWSGFRLREMSQTWADLTGKAYLIVGRDPRSSIPLELWPVRPDRITPVPDPDTYLKGYIYTAPDGRTKVPLDVDDVIAMQMPDPLDPATGGVGPVQSVLVDVDAMKYAGEFNRNFFINSAEPGGVIQVDHAMDDDEWRQLSDRWREAHRGVSRAHRVAVLENGQTWVPNAHTMRDMDFAGLRSASRDIMREAFRMHKVMLGVSDDVNRANAQTGEEVFASWGVVPRLDRWKDTINNFFLPMYGSAADGLEFDYVTPVPANREQDNMELTAKAQAALALVQAGYDRAAVLKAVGLPDMPAAGLAAAAAGQPIPDGEDAADDADPAGSSGIPGMGNLLPWRPFGLHDTRFAKVNGHSLVGAS